ncbi:hypothetical protein R3P38DRAFT_3229543 [Favolaschia claudopus]|uniref:Uncharacterized protein n=1 Tax=Favolaschia claudopus TaxID=2862362 RepID=A0AAV9ZNW7_9AGAR
MPLAVYLNNVLSRSSPTALLTPALLSPPTSDVARKPAKSSLSRDSVNPSFFESSPCLSGVNWTTGVSTGVYGHSKIVYRLTQLLPIEDSAEDSLLFLQMLDGAVTLPKLRRWSSARLPDAPSFLTVSGGSACIDDSVLTGTVPLWSPFANLDSRERGGSGALVVLLRFEFFTFIELSAPHVGSASSPQLQHPVHTFLSDLLWAVAVPSRPHTLSLCTPALATSPPADSPGYVYGYAGLLLLRSPKPFLAECQRERLAGRGGGDIKYCRGTGGASGGAHRSRRGAAQIRSLDVFVVPRARASLRWLDSYSPDAGTSASRSCLATSTSAYAKFLPLTTVSGWDAMRGVSCYSAW